jgi:hypothetical protein
VLDEVETLQRVRSDVRDRGLNALRQFLDEIDAGRVPGLYLTITGTTAFFEGPMGMQRLAPLAQRLATDFPGNPRFDNPRAPQLRLRGFNEERLAELGIRIRDIYAAGTDHRERILEQASDDYIALLARVLTGELGGKVGVVPRVFAKKLVDVLDKVDLHTDFDPRKHYQLTIADGELTEVERNARAATSVDDIDLET